MQAKENFEPIIQFLEHSLPATEMARYIDNAIFNKTAYHVDRKEPMGESDIDEIFLLQGLRNALLEVDNIKIFTRPRIALY